MANILRRNGLPSSPDRKGLTWREFLSRHAEVFVCGDLLTKEIWTFHGQQTAFVFFVLHLRTRRILLAQATFSPNGQWVRQQARHVLWACQEQGIELRFFLRDNDACYSAGFDDLLKGAGVEAVHTPLQAPNANAFAERWVRSLRQECLNHLIIFGLSRLQHVLDEYVTFFNEHRPHQGIENCIPEQFKNVVDAEEQNTDGTCQHLGGMQCRQFLGGLLKSYMPTAA